MGTATPQDMRQATRRRWFRACRAATILIFLGASLACGLVAGLFAAVSGVLPSGEALADIRPPTPTRVLAIDGSLLGKVYLPDQNRELVPITEMGHMVNATLAIEDIRFFSHPGIDLRGIARAMMKNLAARDSKEGASTITQQLARNLYLSREKKLTRKLQEIVLALELERRYAKEEILETYLNQVYYGANTHGLQSWGVQVAAQNYFGKEAKALSIAEAALLAGLPKNPRDYNPYRSLEAARARRNTVLRIMRANGFISRHDYEAARQSPITLIPQQPLSKMADFHAPYFVRHILVAELKRIFGQDANRYIYHYGVDIYTSLDPRMQKVAEEVVERKVRENQFRHIDDGALVALDPMTGQIKAMVGGTNFTKDQFNIVTQGLRQPGSSFKPFVYTTALLRGYTPETIVADVRRSYPSGSGKPWTPKNSDGRYRGKMPLKRALWLSRNAAAVGVAADVGIKQVIEVAHTMGIKHRLDPYLPTALGASVVSPLEICSGYGTLANGGIHHLPSGILRVTTPEGSVLYEYRPRPRRAIPTQIADTMQEIMQGVIERGTGRAARCPFPASGKTGTTNSFRDAWFIGYTEDLVAAVWVGNRHNQAMSRTFGGTVPAPIWHDFMMVAQPLMAAEHKEHQAELARINNLPDGPNHETGYSSLLAPKDPEKLDDAKAAVPTGPTNPREGYTVTLCQQSGQRANSWCPEKVVITYTKGRAPSPPSTTCTVHTRAADIPEADTEASAPSGSGLVLSICAETGKIATEKCPIILQRRYRKDAPTETCPLHGGD